MWHWFKARHQRIARDRFLLPREWAVLRPILERQSVKVRIFFTVLLLEGCRLSELRTARWMDLDLEAQLWHQPQTKNGKANIRPLSHCSCDLLQQLPRESPYCFHGDLDKHGRLDQPWSQTAVRYHWRRIRWQAGCPDLRIHDLRRTTGSWLCMHGENLETIRRILNHASLLTTQVYARLDLETVRAALNRHAGRLLP